MGPMRRVLVAALAVLPVVAGCGPPAVATGGFAAVPRATRVWIGADGIDEATAVRLGQLGVDGVVVRRGSVALAGGAPVVRLEPWPGLAGPLPVAAAYVLDPGVVESDPSAAEVLWRALADDVAEGGASELVLDVTRLNRGLDRLLAQLAAASGLPVTPVLSVEQLRDPGGVAVARAVRSCLVPLYGRPGGALRATDQRRTAPLAERLEPLAGAGVRVRIGISLRPVTEPPLDGWGEPLDALTEGDRCEVTTSSALERTFVVRRALEWSGRSWTTGERIAVGWMDAARLDRAIAETVRLQRPELGGWDLVTLPPPDAGLGIGREALERYLSGEGPDPEVEVVLEGSGSTRRVVLRNRGPFGTAVSGVGNLVELTVDGGRLVAEDRGGFERVSVGTVRDGAWETTIAGAANGVRFYETHLAPGEEVRSGIVRLTSRRSEVSLRWEVILTTGERLEGSLR